MSKIRLSVIGLGAVIALFSFACLSYCFESDLVSREGSSEQRYQILKQVLQLNDAQGTQVQQITQSYETQRQQLKHQLATLQQEEDEKIKSVLTPEQQARFDQWNNRRTQRHDNWKGESSSDSQSFGHRRHAW